MIYDRKWFALWLAKLFAPSLAIAVAVGWAAADAGRNGWVWGFWSGFIALAIHVEAIAVARDAKINAYRRRMRRGRP